MVVKAATRDASIATVETVTKVATEAAEAGLNREGDTTTTTALRAATSPKVDIPTGESSAVLDRIEAKTEMAEAVLALLEDIIILKNAVPMVTPKEHPVLVEVQADTEVEPLEGLVAVITQMLLPDNSMMVVREDKVTSMTIRAAKNVEATSDNRTLSKMSLLIHTDTPREVFTFCITTTEEV